MTALGRREPPLDLHLTLKFLWGVHRLGATLAPADLRASLAAVRAQLPRAEPHQLLLLGRVFRRLGFNEGLDAVNDAAAARGIDLWAPRSAEDGEPWAGGGQRDAAAARHSMRPAADAAAA